MRKADYVFRVFHLDNKWKAVIMGMGARRIFSRGGQIHRHSQDFLWGCCALFS